MGWKDEYKTYLKGKAEGNTFKLSDGENVIRILPNVHALKSGNYEKYEPAFVFKTHPAVGPNKRFAVCGRDRHGMGDCWLCDKKIPALLASKKQGLIAKANDMTARDQALFQIASIDDGVWKGPKPFYVTIGRKRAFGNRLLMHLTMSARPYDDPTKGRNLILSKTGQGLQTEYGDIQSEDAPSSVPQAILAKLKPFSELVKSYSQETQTALYEGREADDDVENAEPPVEEPTGGEPEVETEEVGAEESGEESGGEEYTEDAPSEYEVGAEEAPVEDTEDASVDENTEDTSGDEFAEDPAEVVPPKRAMRQVAPPPARRPAPPPARPAARPAAKPVARPAARRK